MSRAVHPWEILIVAVAGWIHRDQQAVIDYLVEENRVLKGQFRGRRLRLTDDERRTTTACSQGEGPRPETPRRSGRYRHAGHHPRLAPKADREKVGLKPETERTGTATRDA